MKNFILLKTYSDRGYEVNIYERGKNYRYALTNPDGTTVIHKEMSMQCIPSLEKIQNHVSKVIDDELLKYYLSRKLKRLESLL